MRHRCPAGLLTFFLVVPGALCAQPVPSDSSSLMNSEGAGMARYADLNGYPGPKHVLEMQEELGLSEAQVKQMEAIFDEMDGKAQAKGEAIVTAEKRLSRLFEVGVASEETVRLLSTDIGRMRGELRAIHLSAHLQAAAVLDASQKARYTELRHGMRGHKH